MTGTTDRRKKVSARSVNPEALLCALVLAPNTFPRNRFFGLFEDTALRRVRRRAYHVRSILKQLLGQGNERALLIGRMEMADSRVMLRYRVDNVKLERTTALSALESAVLNYALHRAGKGEIEEEERALVEVALHSLDSDAPRETLP